MSDMKHTPGPWYRQEGLGGETYVRDRNGVVACVCASPRVAGNVSANANLIAAAPDLLAACEAQQALIQNLWQLVGGNPDSIGKLGDYDQACKAIADAKRGAE